MRAGQRSFEHCHTRRSGIADGCGLHLEQRERPVKCRQIPYNILHCIRLAGLRRDRWDVYQTHPPDRMHRANTEQIGREQRGTYWQPRKILKTSRACWALLGLRESISAYRNAVGRSRNPTLATTHMASPGVQEVHCSLRDVHRAL